MRTILLDVETVGLAEAPQWFDPIRPKANLRDPEKIKADIAEKTADRDERLGLDPDCCRIVALCYHVVGGAEPTVMLAKTEDEERELLRKFWLAYTAIPNTRLVTFNGHKFDLVVMQMRSIYLGVKFPRLTIAPAWKTNHLDVWQWLSFDGARRDVHSLAFYARRFGITTLDKVDGSDIARLVADEKWAEIEGHCLSDVGLLHAIANRLNLLEAA